MAQEATIPFRLRDEVHPSRLIPTLTAGVVTGLVEVVVAGSFAALIFSGDAAVHLPAGIGLSLFAAVVVMTVIAVLSSVPGAVASVQDSTAAILALTASSVVVELDGGPEETFLTIVAVIALASVLTGVFLVTLGRFRLGNLVRFVPYPVVGGFLAGTGWLLFKGGVGVLTGTSMSLASLHEFARGEQVMKWLPGLVFAVVVLVLVRRSGHFLIIPTALVSGLVLFYAVLFATGQTVPEAKTQGWLLGPFPAGTGLWDAWTVAAVSRADWGAVLGHIVDIATLLVVAVLALLLNVSGIELALNRDADLNRELRAAGVANIAAGLGGGIVGFHALSLTVLTHRTGSRSRLVGVVAAAVCGAALVSGPNALSLFPRALLGGMVVFLGLAFIVDWVYDAWFKLPRRDYVVVVLILLVVGAIGFLAGVAVGLLAALALFVIDYSRTDVVRADIAGSHLRSNVDREPHQLEVLRTKGERIHVLRLQGFVFFGTANSLLERVRRRVQDPDVAPLLFLVIDFRRVPGLDSSAVLTFMKTHQLATAQNFTLLLTGLSPRVSRQLERGGLDESVLDRVRVFSDLDRAVQWCEDRLLEHEGISAADVPESLSTLLREGLNLSVDPTMLMPYLEPIDVPEGHEVIRQGAAADDLYFLESGRLTITLALPDGDTMRLRTVSPGVVVGEVGMYLGETRTASVVAETASRLYRLSRTSLAQMEHHDSELAAELHRAFAKLLARRLTDSLAAMEALLD